MASELKDLNSVADLSKYFEVAPHTIRRWIKDGVFERVVRIGNRLYIEREQVQKYIKSMYEDTPRAYPLYRSTDHGRPQDTRIRRH